MSQKKTIGPSKAAVNKPETTSTTTLRPPAVCVIVLGDIGRSPRMQYHTKSLLEHGYTVDIVGYLETDPLRQLLTDPNAKIHSLAPFPATNLPRILRYLFKTVWALLTLLAALLYVRRPRYVLVQNPPAIPALLVCSLYCALTRAQLIIDWHNYTHSILALECGPDRLIVHIARWVERRFGRKAAYNLCVTQAMQRDLREQWSIEAQVFYDRPAPQFQPIAVEQKHDLFVRLAVEYPVQFGCGVVAEKLEDGEGVEESTRFTVKTFAGDTRLRLDRPALLMSSTSWTPDEDFQILLGALDIYEAQSGASEASHLPPLLCVITGRGPQRDYYLEQVAKRKYCHVDVLAPWLSADDYALLLASADLGVCLHRSSSGLDLPMKVVDMFGSGLPVCAFNFNCIGELVQEHENGFLFETDAELGEQIVTWFRHHPNNISLVNIKERFQQNLRRFQALRWTENWNNVVLPLFMR